MNVDHRRRIGAVFMTACNFGTSACMLVLYPAFYSAMAVRERAAHFYRWTVYGKTPLIVFWAALIGAGIAPMASLLIGVIESASGIWTGVALRSEKLRHLREMPSLGDSWSSSSRLG
jgi:hypothetical protein